MNLTPNQKRALRHLWKGELTLEEIAEEMCFSAEQLDAAVALLGLPEREETDIYLPTREEILLAAAEIRAGWTQAEREARLASARSVRMEDATELDNHACRRATHHRDEGSTADGSPR
jgi:hypothetical protein